MAIEVRVSVRLGDSAVRRPAGMTQRRAPARQAGRGLADLACVLFHQQPGLSRAVLTRRDTPRVVAAVLQLFQSHQDLLSRVVACTDVTEYAAHMRALLSSRRGLMLSVSATRSGTQRAPSFVAYGTDTLGRL